VYRFVTALVDDLQSLDKAALMKLVMARWPLF
jgi:hypothetical protein